MTEFKSELINGAPLRRVVIELPEHRALALARAINDISWFESEAEDDLKRLHTALGEDFGDDHGPHAT